MKKTKYYVTKAKWTLVLHALTDFRNSRIAEGKCIYRLHPYRYLLRLLTYLPGLGKTPARGALDTLLSWSPETREECGKRSERKAG